MSFGRNTAMSFGKEYYFVFRVLLVGWLRTAAGREWSEKPRQWCTLVSLRLLDTY